MLKWTASAQKLNTDSPIAWPQRRLHGSENTERRRRARRATIANKENIPYATSTPMVPATRASRNSPLVLAPLADILNITPEVSASSTSAINATLTPDRRRIPTVTVTATATATGTAIETTATTHAQKRKHSVSSRSRRHSTIGITLPSAVPFYARTLPRFQVEEYSPSTASPPTGQQLALRGLLPDPFLANARYFQTPETQTGMQKQRNTPIATTKSQLTKRNLDIEFATENAAKQQDESKPAQSDITGVNSSKMGNETLDKLIDAILDSARKDVKKKKSRKSFNLRRRTLLKSHAEVVEDLGLSPSYAAGDDPASDLSFLLVEPTAVDNASTVALRSLNIAPTPTVTPSPATPPPGTPRSQSILCGLPTPKPALNVSTTTFKLETPVRPQTRKRRQTHQPHQSKKFKVDARSYFEIGVALPSIYV